MSHNQYVGCGFMKRDISVLPEDLKKFQFTGGQSQKRMAILEKKKRLREMTKEAAKEAARKKARVGNSAVRCVRELSAMPSPLSRSGRVRNPN